MLSYVRWYWADDDIWAYDELDADRWSLRHVESREGVFLVAAEHADTLRRRSHPGEVR